jgi:two-component system, LytTR family, response regulator
MMKQGRRKRLPVLLEEVIRLEAQGNYTQLTLTNARRFILARTLRSFEETLAENFIRVHKNCIVNNDYLDTLFAADLLLQLKDGTTVPVARRRLTEVKKQIKKLSLPA